MEVRTERVAGLDAPSLADETLHSNELPTTAFCTGEADEAVPLRIRKSDLLIK